MQKKVAISIPRNVAVESASIDGIADLLVVLAASLRRTMNGAIVVVGVIHFQTV